MPAATNNSSPFSPRNDAARKLEDLPLVDKLDMQRKGSSSLSLEGLRFGIPTWELERKTSNRPGHLLGVFGLRSDSQQTLCWLTGNVDRDTLASASGLAQFLPIRAAELPRKDARADGSPIAKRWDKSTHGVVDGERPRGEKRRRNP